MPEILEHFSGKHIIATTHTGEIKNKTKGTLRSHPWISGLAFRVGVRDRRAVGAAATGFNGSME